MRILVSGAGIAGSAATLFLRASGHDVVTIDRAPSFQKLGYLHSLKYFGLGVMVRPHPSGWITSMPRLDATR